ncbi:outer membrane protein TolC [Lutibacter oceani]|jgi:outer membrane protein TolC|uniref:Outer membrane protein TolC n=1 Tax=Lutibacter oceani TaxID=1853311 RepID=A0A3D9RU98_9FLAO|nr:MULTISPECIES: TolC family protein [Lutibacter]NLP59034.1 TolC family protein [Lutibacter sp. B1]REE80282.1 outer membrane protein TolC [Lutibacter oceani]
MKINLIVMIAFLLTLTVKAQSLNDYLQIASENNPELKAIQYKYESALEKVVEVGSLPNTTISVGYFAQEVETRVGAQKAKISASQMLPWFGTLNAKQESAQFNAAAQLNNYEFAKRKLFLDVKTTYFELFELNQKEQLLVENIEILKTFESLALNELENNRSTMVDVLKIRMEKNELLNQLSTVQENLSAKKIAFNLLLNRDEKSTVLVVENVNIIYSEDFNKEQISDNPKLLQLENLKNASEKSELATKKEGLPTIGIGLDYGFIENRAVENLADNGKDIVMPMVTVSFPLFSKKYSSKQKQLQLEQKAIETTKVNTYNQLQTVFENAKSKLSNSKVSIATQIKNINEAESAKKVLLAAYETSKIDFEQLLEIQQLQLKFQLKKVISEKEYEIQKSTLEFLTKDN